MYVLVISLFVVRQLLAAPHQLSSSLFSFYSILFQKACFGGWKELLVLLGTLYFYFDKKIIYERKSG